TDAQLAEVEAYIQENVEHITETARYTGGGLPNIFNSSLDQSGENTGQIVVRVDRENTSASDFIETYQDELRDEFPEGEIFLETILSGPPPSPTLELKLKGSDLDILLEKATTLQEDLNDLDSVDIATMNTGSSKPVKTYEIDRDFLAENGIPINQVTGTLQFANAGVPLSEITVKNERLPIEIKLDEGAANSIDLSELTAVVAAHDEPPEFFTYDEFITEKTGEQLATISHENGKRTITISAYESEEGDFVNETSTIIESMQSDLDTLNGDYALVED